MPAQTSVSRVQPAVQMPAPQPSMAQPPVPAATPLPSAEPALPSKAAQQAVQGAPTAGLQLALPSAVVVVPRTPSSSPYETLKNLFAVAHDPIAFTDVEAVDATARSQHCVYTRKAPEQLTDVDVWHATLRSQQQGGQGPLFPPSGPRDYVGYGDRALAERASTYDIKVVKTPNQITTETRNSPTDPTLYSTSVIRKKGDLLAFSFKQPNFSADPVFGYCWREPAPAAKGG